MTLKEIAHKMDDLTHKAWILRGVSLAVNDAIVDGACEAKEYAGALYALTDMVCDIKVEIDELNQELFAFLKST